MACVLKVGACVTTNSRGSFTLFPGSFTFRMQPPWWCHTYTHERCRMDVHARMCPHLLSPTSRRDIEILRDHVEHLVATEAAAGNCKLVQVDVVEPFPATINDARRSRIVVNAAAAVGGTSSSAGAVGGLDVTKMDTPFPWSEDFGWFGESYKEEGAVLFGIGSGEECPPLHSKTYDFPDALLPIGIELWSNIARKALA